MQHEQDCDNRMGMVSNNTILVGVKPLMNYVTAVVMQFTTQNAESVVIRARGKFISKAVDAAEVATKRFLENQVAIRDVKTNSEEFATNEGKQVRVSSIEITVGRSKPAPDSSHHPENEGRYE